MDGDGLTRRTTERKSFVFVVVAPFFLFTRFIAFPVDLVTGYKRTGTPSMLLHTLE